MCCSADQRKKQASRGALVQAYELFETSYMPNCGAQGGGGWVQRDEA